MTDKYKTAGVSADRNKLSLGRQQRFGLTAAVGPWSPMRRISILSRRKRRFRSQHAVIVLGAILVIAYGASTFLSIRRGYQQTLRDAAATLESVASSAEIGTSQLLLEIDTTLLGVDRMLTTVFSAVRWDDAEVRALLRQFDEQNLAISGILILDDEGREINSSRAADSRSRSSSHSAFVAEHRSATPAGLFIAPPVVRGMIAAAVPIAAFTGFFQEIVTSGATRISLLLDNGILIADLPDWQQVIGTVPKFAPALLAATAKQPAGLLDGFDDRVGEPGRRSFRRVPQHPLIVSVSRGLADILRQRREERTTSIADWLLFAWTAVTLAIWWCAR